jgi:uncharacterized damage-inducible protein DinB
MSQCAHLAGVIVRDLDSIRREIELYPVDADLWRPMTGVANPAGNLALHLAGNLQHFVGALLGGTGYRRDRDAEFSRRDLPRAEVLAAIEAARAAVDATLARLTDADLERVYPQAVAGVQLTTGEFLVHLVSHLGYHIGQMDTHRRLATGVKHGGVAQSIPALRSAKPIGG